jgi:hypothetical protein
MALDSSSSSASASGIVMKPQHERVSMTESARMWGFSLQDVLPCQLSEDGIVAVPGDVSRIGRFLSEQFALFSEEAQGATPNYIVRNRKHEYLRDACDLVELRLAEQTIGVLIGAPEDWSSYYVRVFAMRRDFQRPGMIRRFIRDCLFAPLTVHSVERICADTSPANTAMSRLLTELHFHVTGSHLSDRWGPMVRYTRFLSPACEAEFRRKFGGGSPAGGPRKIEEAEA